MLAKKIQTGPQLQISVKNVEPSDKDKRKTLNIIPKLPIPVLMPEQPQGYIKPSRHDFL